MSPRPIGVLGGGSFGRALAAAISRTGQRPLLWTRQTEALPNVTATQTSSFSDLADADLIYVAVPSTHIESVATELGRYLDGRHMLVHVSRGLVGQDLQTVSQRLRLCTPARRVGALAGPLVASALERGDPSGGIIGTRFDEVSDAVRLSLSTPTLRIYDTSDIVGVELASAMVGLLSLAIGFARGLDVGPGTLGVFATRGMAEAVRLGRLRGAQPETFAGLAGAGDLLAAVAGDERPELKLGHHLATDLKFQSDGKPYGAYIEGIDISHRVTQYGRRMGIETPITDTVSSVIRRDLAPKVAMERLMARRVGKE